MTAQLIRRRYQPEPWQPTRSDEEFADFLDWIGGLPLGEVLAEAAAPYITDDALKACLREMRGAMATPTRLAANQRRRERRIQQKSVAAMTDQQMSKGAEILARIEQNRKTA